MTGLRRALSWGDEGTQCFRSAEKGDEIKDRRWLEPGGDASDARGPDAVGV